MIEGRPRESLVLYEAPFEVSFVSDLFSKFKFKAHSDENLFVFKRSQRASIMTSQIFMESLSEVSLLLLITLVFQPHVLCC